LADGSTAAGGHAGGATTGADLAAPAVPAGSDAERSAGGSAPAPRDGAAGPSTPGRVVVGRSGTRAVGRSTIGRFAVGRAGPRRAASRAGRGGSVVSAPDRPVTDRPVTDRPGPDRPGPESPAPDPAGRTAPVSDLDLLRAYEPVLRYTAGELFLPTSVEAYLARCSLWADGGGRRRRPAQLVRAGDLTPEQLAVAGRRFRGRALYLRFVQEHLARGEVARWRREDRPRLRGKARFAAVGVLTRLIDALLRLSLLVRGRVPGGLVAAAHKLGAAITDDPGAEAGGSVRTYYGRVVRTAGYTVLQYWYFYAFNDWRSTFYGVNDHEADWETVAVYLVDDPEAPDRLRPAWVAASSHELAGPDLRRRWDDPQLRREGDHPVVYPGAGSHAGALLPGDYVVSVELPALRRIVGRLQQVRRQLLPWTAEPGRGAFALPFVDYARGDGPAIGPGREVTWRVEPIDDDTPWVRDYRGLWGLDTHDPFGGERAPAGPRYGRTGTLRPSWADPLGWVGLAAVPATPAEEEAHLRARIAVVDVELGELEAEIEAERATVRGLSAQARSLDAAADTRALRRVRVAELERRERALATLTAQRAALAEERAAHTAYLAGPRDPGPPAAHLRHPHLPYAALTDLRSRFLRVWAAVSTPVLVLGLGGLLLRPSVPVLVGFLTFLVVFGVVEAIGRRRVLAFATVVGALALWVVAVAGLILALLSSWHLVLAGLLAAAALVLLVVNVRELRSD
jgi:hypothetical protein